MFGVDVTTVTRGRAHVEPVAGVTVAQDVLADVARTADRGSRAVDAVWGADWARQATLLVGDRGSLESAVGSTAGLPAVAVTLPATGNASDGAPTVLVDGELWSSLPPTSRLVVLTHELTHVATGSPGAGVPLWFEEGFADYVGWRSNGVPVTVAAEEGLAAVAADGLPERLPADAALTLSGAGAAAAYGISYVAVRLLAQTYGEDAVVEIYRLALADPRSGPSARPGAPESALDGALTAVTGQRPDALVAAWRAELDRLAS